MNISVLWYNCQIMLHCLQCKRVVCHAGYSRDRTPVLPAREPITVWLMDSSMIFLLYFSSQISVYFSDSYEHRFKELSVICGAFCWYTHLRFSILDSFVDYFLFAQQWRHAGFSSQVAELIFNFNSFKIWEKNAIRFASYSLYNRDRPGVP